MSCMSMTGFGRSEVEDNGLQLEIEIRSVNHRYLDSSFKLPAVYTAFEQRLVKQLKCCVKRGRIEAVVIRKDRRLGAEVPQCNTELLKAYIDVVRDAAEALELPADDLVQSAALNAVGRREFVELSSADDDALDEELPLLEQVFQSAVDELVAMRTTEGAALQSDLETHLASLEQLVLQMEDAGKDTAEMFRERLANRLQRLEPAVELDPQRLAQEVALMADRTDFSEEAARLKSHCGQFRDVLNDGGGRKLDFLVQEMMREVNTIGAKAQNSNVSTQVVEAKTTIEKLREQVQNVE